MHPYLSYDFLTIPGVSTAIKRHHFVQLLQDTILISDAGIS